MINFGLRLTLRGGREAAVRLVVTAVAVALGVGLLLVTLAALNGVTKQNTRWAWLNSGVAEVTSANAPVSRDPLWGALSTDLYKGQNIIRVDLAATGPQSPVLPGIPRLPGPGEYFASPAVSTLLRSVPAEELGDRYPGRQIGTIAKPGLPAPDSLIIVVGRSVDEVSHLRGAAQVTAIADTSPGRCSGCRYGFNAQAVDLTLSVTAAALLFPILIFIGTATRLSAARREQRFAAMRLVGATPRQVSLVSAVESSVAALAGTAAGFALFFLFRVPLAAVPITGDRFYPGDLSLRPVDVLLVAIGVPLAAAIATRIALRRVQISPLGVTRRGTPRAPNAYRLIPLVAGLVELSYFVGRRPETTAGQTRAYLTGILVTMAGLVIAGPWLTMVGSRVMARRTSRPAMLIAGRRLSDNPKAGFRAISGLVLALFVTSTAVGVMTAMVAERGVPSGNQVTRSTLVEDFSDGWSKVPGVPRSSVGPVPDSVVARLSSIPGVRGVTLIHANPLGTLEAQAPPPVSLRGPRLRPPPPVVAGLMSCQQSGGVSGFGRCAAGAEVASVPTAYEFDPPPGAVAAGRVWPAAPISSERLKSVPVQSIIVSTTGAASAVERVRTALATTFPGRDPAATYAEDRVNSDTAKQMAGYQQLAKVVILVSLCVAGCGLAVSVVGSLNDRKRPFSLLRLTGVQLSTLRSVVALESVVPLLVNAVLAAGTGFLAAGLFLRSQLDYALRPPGVGYYFTVLAGLAVALAVIASTLPLLKRITGPETARNE